MAVIPVASVSDDGVMAMLVKVAGVVPPPPLPPHAQSDKERKTAEHMSNRVAGRFRLRICMIRFQ